MEQENIDRFVAAVLKAWEAIKEFIQKFVKAITKALQCKPLRRAYMRQYYTLLAEGKSNNWRKYHGLKTIRR